MATRSKTFAFLIQRFKGFWNQYRQSKRGMLGIAILVLFAVVAIFAPFLTPYDAMNPLWPGYYPSTRPTQADGLCVPIWYKSLLGMTGLSENMQLVQDHEFTSQELFNTQWRVGSSPAGYDDDVNVQWSPTKGNNNRTVPGGDGCVAITYTRAESQTPPEGGKIEVVLSRDFTFPYEDNPQSFFWHYSASVEHSTPLVNFPLRVTISIRRAADDQSYVVKDLLMTAFQTSNKWFSKAGTTPGEGDPIEETIFTHSGNYTFDLKLTITEPAEGSVNMTVRLDNAQMILYGKAFGLLGTTNVEGQTPRDIFTMLVYGARISFMIGSLTAVFSVIIGLAVGLVAGYLRGLVDELMMRFADFLLVIPSLPLLIIMVTVLGRSIWNIVGVLIFMGWMGFSRSVRSMVLSIRERPFVESAKAAGAGTFYVIYRHILPNVFALVYISLATAVPGAIISEASLAWLGLGDINIPSWGILLYDFSSTQIGSLKSIGEYWFWVIPPGVAIALMAMSFILIGFALDEILNPRLRKRQ
jgi:ABC-type dipeptide/oligopeptide/nickel transport system permease subunit